MDSVKLGMVAVDQLHPLLSDLMSSLNSIPREIKGKEKIKVWLIALNQKKASDGLDEEQARQFHFDLESAHTEFHRSLQ
ncbi:Vacuolar protein-sorting-associated protein 28 [Coelomomyces lativittatus]|nr:Vacuolar protein-sorting-associated protein 28 [Coelomomyces lativittatus]